MSLAITCSSKESEPPTCSLFSKDASLPLCQRTERLAYSTNIRSNKAAYKLSNSQVNVVRRICAQVLSLLLSWLRESIKIQRTRLQRKFQLKIYNSNRKLEKWTNYWLNSNKLLHRTRHLGTNLMRRSIHASKRHQLRRSTKIGLQR